MKVKHTSSASKHTSWLLLAALVLSACQQEPLCKELSDCGGDFPIGNWALGPGQPSCQEDLYIPPTDNRLVRADLVPKGVPLPEQAFFDWCSLLIAGTDNIQNATPRFYLESAPVGAATVRYDSDGSYAMGFVRTGTYTFDFPPLCMRQFGATDGKAAVPGGQPLDICKQLEVPLRASGIGEGAYRNTTCEVNPAEPLGCICQFDAAATGGSGGKYIVLSHNEILHVPGTPGFPYKVTYCRQGDRLQLTGTDGEYLFGQPGLRTLDLGRTN